MKHIPHPVPTEGFDLSIAARRDTRSLIQSWLRSDTSKARLSIIDKLPHGYKSAIFNMFAKVHSLLKRAEEDIDSRDRTINLVKQVAHFVVQEKQLKDEMFLAQSFCENSQLSSCRIVYDLKETRPKAVTRIIEEHQIHLCLWMACVGEGSKIEADQQCDYLIKRLQYEHTAGQNRCIIKPI